MMIFFVCAYPYIGSERASYGFIQATMRFFGILLAFLSVSGALTLPKTSPSEKYVSANTVDPGKLQGHGIYCGLYSSDNGHGGTLAATLYQFNGTKKDCQMLKYQHLELPWVKVEVTSCKTCHLYT